MSAKFWWKAGGNWLVMAGRHREYHLIGIPASKHALVTSQFGTTCFLLVPQTAQLGQPLGVVYHLHSTAVIAAPLPE